MAVHPFSTPRAPAALGHYSPAVRAGDWVVCSGQLGVEPATGDLADGLGAQTRQALANLTAVLGDAGAGWGDVAKVTVFLAVDLAGAPLVNQVYAEALGEHRPARSTVQVAALPRGALVEIEAWAYLAR